MLSIHEITEKSTGNAKFLGLLNKLHTEQWNVFNALFALVFMFSRFSRPLVTYATNRNTASIIR
jgi:hypothetical protein